MLVDVLIGHSWTGFCIDKNVFIKMNLTCSNISHERFPEYRSDALVWPSHDVTIAISEELFAPQNRHGGVYHIVVNRGVPVRYRRPTCSLQPDIKS